MNRIAILGSSNALKPFIVLENIISMNLFPGKEIILITNNSDGILYEYAVAENIEVLIVNSRLKDKESKLLLQESNLDLLASCGWPYLIPEEILNLFRYPSINCHGSILPDYRGSRSYMHYWANCEEYYGATIHYMNEKLDDGNVIIQGKLKLFLDETPEILHRRTAELCAYLLPRALSLVEDGFEGNKTKGLKRYFFKLSHDEFLKYRKINEKKGKNKRILTPHKKIE